MDFLYHSGLKFIADNPTDNYRFRHLAQSGTLPTVRVALELTTVKILTTDAMSLMAMELLTCFRRYVLVGIRWLMVPIEVGD